MRFHIVVCVIICGLCLGGLNGLSISPVIQSTIATILTLIITILSVVTGLKANDEAKESEVFKQLKKLNLVPVTLFLVGYIIGACGGTFVRTNDLLGTRPNLAYKKWKEFGVTKKGYLDLYNKRSESSYALSGVLLGSEATICDLIKNKHGEELRAELDLNLEYFDKDLQDRLRPVIARGDSLGLELTKNSLCE